MGLFDELKKALAERVLNAELDDHLDNEAAEGSRDRRNGYSKKTVLTETAKIDVAFRAIGKARSTRS
jgi:putative transposase